MRVLINALGATMGGALRHLTNFLPALAEAPGSHSYDVLVRSSIGIVSPCDRIRLIRWKDSRAGNSFYRAFADLIGSAISARDYGALVSLMNFGPILCPIPHVLFQRNALYFSPAYRSSLDAVSRLELGFRRRWTIEAMRFADRVITPSQAMASMIFEDCRGLPKTKFQTLYHGFEAATLTSGDRESTATRGEAFPKLLCIAHLGRYKNFEVLLRALSLLKSSWPNVRLYLTFDRSDDAEDFDYYARMAEQLGVTDQVEFLGRIKQSDIGQLYRHADVFLFPSFCESFGFPLMEAIGSGVPIAASDIPVNHEICGGAALYFDPQDASACAECIQAIVGDPACALSLKRNGQQVLNSFDWSWRRYAREFVEIIETVAVRSALRGAA